jgi:hypothetical protein
MTEWVCPHCGLPAPGPGLLCSGSFLDTDHPANVAPVERSHKDSGSNPGDIPRPLAVVKQPPP